MSVKEEKILKVGLGRSAEQSATGVDRATDPTVSRGGDEHLERILLEQIRNGNDASFEQLVIAHTPRTLNLAYRLVANREDAEEIAQTAFLKLHRTIPGFRGECSISTWLYTTVSRLAIDHLKRETQRKKIFFFARRADEDVDLLEQVPDPAASPRDQLLTRETEKRLTKVLESLSPQQRTVFVLRHQEELPLREIAELLNLELGTVKAHLHRAVMVLRKKLYDLQGGSP